jgi:hypothetical protein
MIITFAFTQRINCSIETCFDFLSHLTNMPRWNYFIQRVTQLSPGAVANGTLFEQKRPHDLLRIKVEEFIPPNKVMFRVQSPGPNFLCGFVLTAIEGQTEVHYSWTLDLQQYSLLKYLPSGIFKNWILSIVKRQIMSKTKPAAERNFSKLKVLLETGEVTLQDGRRMTLANN